jgi:hypothetical protein
VLERIWDGVEDRKSEAGAQKSEVDGERSQVAAGELGDG